MFPVAIFSAPNHICPGTCTDFVNLSQNGTSFQWTFAGASPASSTDVNPATICYNTPGTYSVELIATNAITSDTLLLNNFITVYPYPAPQGILQSGDTLFANAGAVSYQWYHDGTLIQGATEYFYVAAEGGRYNLVATDNNGCEVEAVIFDVVASSGELTEANQFIKIFPNPARDEMIIQSESPSSGRNTIDAITIFNLLGEKVIEKKLSSNMAAFKIDISTISRGSYFLELNTNDKLFRQPFLKQ